MKTKLTPISELNPGDKIHVPWPEDKKKPDWWKLPEVVTVKKVDERSGTVDIEETGGLNLKESELYLVIGLPTPEAGDTITFMLETFNDLGLRVDKQITTQVDSICKDPMKRHKPKCIVTVEGKGYGIPFDEISEIVKPEPIQINKPSQLQLF